MPTQLNIVLANSLGTVVLPISAGLQAIDSGASGGQGVASGQTGTSSVDQAIRNIYRAGVFYVPASSTWYGSSQIQSITWT
jgi:hypothetical protein